VPEPERVGLVTGATAGIGLETAVGLARAGMRVILHGRDEARTEAARRAVAERARSDKLEAAVADFASLAQVRALAETVLSAQDRLDVLVNNAGLIAPRFRTLRGRLRADDRGQSPGAVPADQPTARPAARLGAFPDSHGRVDGASWRPARFEDLDRAAGLGAAHRLWPLETVQHPVHPGAGKAARRQRRHRGLPASRDHRHQDRRHRRAGRRLRLAADKPFLASLERCAATSIFLATVPDPTPFHGKYVIGRRPHQPDAPALDDSLAEALWAESARLTGLTA